MLGCRKSPWSCPRLHVASLPAPHPRTSRLNPPRGTWTLEVTSLEGGGQGYGRHCTELEVRVGGRGGESQQSRGAWCGTPPPYCLVGAAALGSGCQKAPCMVWFRAVGVGSRCVWDMGCLGICVAVSGLHVADAGMKGLAPGGMGRTQPSMNGVQRRALGSTEAPRALTCGSRSQNPVG